MDRFDIVVVGAGIMGVASAFHLMKNNPRKRILLVDRFSGPGQGNTGRSNAMFRNTFSSPDNQILSNSAIEFYLHLQHEMNTDLGLQQIGYLWLMSDRQLSDSQKSLDGMVKNGIDIRKVTRGELKRLIPNMVLDLGSDAEASIMTLPNIEAGVFGLKCGRLDPDRLVKYYANEFLRMGGHVSFNTDAERLLIGPSERLDIEGEPFVWQDSKVEGVLLRGALIDMVKADVVVLTCGAWGNELLGPVGIDGHVIAKKRQLFSLEGSSERGLGELLHTKGFNSLGLLPMVILPKAGIHFKPVSEESAFWTGCEDEVNQPLTHVPNHDLDGYSAERRFYERNISPVLTAYFPPFRNVKVKAMWAGLYSYNTLDYLPFVFRQNNLIVAGGDSGSGIMKGDSLGRIVDGVYRDEKETMLYGGVWYEASKIGFQNRNVEREEWVI